MDLNTYLFFDGQCEEAFRLYEKVLGGKLAGLMRYADAPSGRPSFKECNRVIHVSLRVGDRVLMGSDMPAGGLDPMPPGHQLEAYKTPRGFRANVEPSASIGPSPRVARLPCRSLKPSLRGASACSTTNSARRA
jgi:hypothetical protein